ncbi:hypothetical protein ABIC08_006393 [Bradyrhizobium sp. RT9b]|uniref:hypothetical protein n=1 Tax=Bradyrhizobium sp. RT9b TaxID=3156385 RepID=UPI00339519C1
MAKAAKKKSVRARSSARKATKKLVRSRKTSTPTAKKKAKKAAARAKKATPKRMANALETIAFVTPKTPSKPQTKCRKIDGECIMFGLSPTGYDIPMGKVDCSRCESYF